MLPLEFLALSYPNIDPVLIEIGPLAVRWYALAYVAGILLGYGYIKKLNARMDAPLLTSKQLEDLILWAILGIILGGRLGYVLFYNADYYLEHPAQALQIWKGGMAFHGGMLGVIAAFYLFARRTKVAYLTLMDLIAAAAPIGLFFGRLANFINGELYGRVTDVPWAMVFPRGGELPRHPSQLYEAGLEGLALFVILYGMIRSGALQIPGLVGGMFLVGYGASRALVECFREPDAHLGAVLGPLTMGQLLSLPMVALGLFLIIYALKQRKTA